MDLSTLQSGSTDVKKVMISSTALDLPEHRDLVKDACLRQGMFPMMMEYLPAADADAIEESLRMVNEADIYLGIFAYRYGYIPKGHNISVTEMEYNRAVERCIPRLIFLMDQDHSVKPADVETGEGSVKLKALKERMKAERVVNFFKSPAELQAQVIDSLSKLRQPNLTAFHYVSEIPTPPEPYIAHPYTLLQTNLVGRQSELNMLTDWVTKPSSNLYKARILSIVAIGGMGKSALTWKWFSDIASQEMKPLAGRLWWSYYESDATFENFVIRALSYVSKRPREEIQKLPPPEREEQLLSILDREPFLFVLDGLERILIAYARMDAARLSDDDLDQSTANVVAGALGLPESAAQSFIGQHRWRKTADLRTGAFLRKLAATRSSVILISPRLYPADLQTDTGNERFGCGAIFLHGLSDDDAINLWRAFGISGSRETLMPIFHTFDSHPLLIQALAGEVSHDRRTPGDFDSWRKNHPDFSPFSLPLVQVRSHVLEFALRGLDKTTVKVLDTIAAFRMPAAYDTLVALLVGKRKPCSNENKLISILADLEDRGLLGWDRRANRYDLHPIVRGVTWSVLDNQDKLGIYHMLSTHFESLPMIDRDHYREVNSLEDLTPAIELYNTLIGLGRYDDAVDLFYNRLENAMRFRLSAYRQGVELLEMFFSEGIDQLPHLSSPAGQSYVLNTLALSINDQPGRQAQLFRRCIDIDDKEDDQESVSIDLCNLSDVLRFSGALRESEATAHQALLIARQKSDQVGESNSLYWLGITLAVRGKRVDSAKALDRSLELAHQGAAYQPYDYQAMHAVWFGKYTDAQMLANMAMNYSLEIRFESGMIRSARLQGEVALGLGNLTTADERLHHALARARTVNLVEGELPTLIGLAEIRRRQNELKSARELLDEVWEPCERGPFKLFHADAYNVLAQIERDTGNHEAAAKAATEAYRLAWCDGPPFAYHWGLQKAKAHLAALGVPEPNMPPFDESNYEPMPEVEIVPLDEEENEFEIEP
jgi:tetratricopeptide (TPR) repeat protein